MAELDIGANLRRLRRDRQLSLAGMAEQTGISSSMLGQIERGESSPTLSTLQKLSEGLKISYDELLGSKISEPQLIDAADLPVYRERAGKYRLKMLIPYDRKRRFEQVYAEIFPGQVCGRVHEEEYTEYVSVQQGELLLRIESEEYRMKPGQCMRIPRGTEHVYCNRGTGALILLITLSYEEF